MQANNYKFVFCGQNVRMNLPGCQGNGRTTGDQRSANNRKHINNTVVTFISQISHECLSLAWQLAQIRLIKLRERRARRYACHSTIVLSYGNSRATLQSKYSRAYADDISRAQIDVGCRRDFATNNIVGLNDWFTLAWSLNAAVRSNCRTTSKGTQMQYV